MAIIFTDSAGKHACPHSDALNAVAHARYVRAAFSKSRVPGLPDPTLYLGPGHGGELLEVMLYETADDVVIFHVMQARQKFLDWL